MVEPIRRWFWFCSGANVPLLEGCPTEYTKHAAIGATIFFTAVLAALSGGYALFTVFKSHALALPFALLWGLLIFNLDRFIVSSMRKESRILQDLAIALPRLIIAFIISIVVVVPIELRLFEREIDARFQQEKRRKTHEYDEGLLSGPESQKIQKIESRKKSLQSKWDEYEGVKTDIAQGRDPERRDLEIKLEKIEKQIARLEDEKTSFVAEILRLEVEATKEREGLRESGQRGQGPIFRSLRASIESKQKYILELERRIAGLEAEKARREEAIREWRAETEGKQSRIAELQGGIQEDIRTGEARIRQLKQQLQEGRDRFTAALDRSDSFLTRVNLLGKLARENSTVDWVVTFIRLLVIALEISPILVKLLSSRGPYDACLEAVERQSIVTHAIRLLEADDRYEIHRNSLQRSRPNKIAARVEAALRELESPPEEEQTGPRSWQ